MVAKDDWIDGEDVYAADLNTLGAAINALDVHAAAAKTTPVDADEVGLIDSAASNVLKKLTWANLKAAVRTSLGLARVFPLDISYASTDASPVDATTYIQSVLDACETAGGGVVLIPTLPAGYHFFHTFNTLGDYTVVAGSGRASRIKQMPGITYNNGTTNTGSYGLSCKTALHSIGFYNFAYDGNADNCADAASDFGSAFTSGSFVAGRYKCSNIAIDRLARGTTSDGTWVSPDHVFIDQVWSENGVRDNFLFQMKTNRATSGVLQAGRLYAKNSAIDHLFYADESEHAQVEQLVCQGYWHDGALAVSGAKIGSVIFSDLAANPYNNATNSYDFESTYCIDDRSDDKGSAFRAVSCIGDFEVLGGTSATRSLLRTHSFGCTVNSIQTDYTGSNADLDFILVAAEGGSTAPGTQEGPTISHIKARNMPSKTRIFSHDPNAWGGNLWGGSVNNVYMTIHPDGATQNIGLFHFQGATVKGFSARDIIVDTEDFTTGGPSAIFENACTSAFTDVLFDHIEVLHAGNSQPWIDATTVASNVKLNHCRTVGTAAITRAHFDAVESVKDCNFGSAKWIDGKVETVRRTTDQSMTSTTTLANDDTLRVWLRVSGVYLIEVVLYVDADVTGAIKLNWTAPSGTTLVRQTDSGTDMIPAGPFATGTVKQVRVSVTTSGTTTAGLLTLRWAQNASSATATTVKTGSIITARRIS